VKVQQFKAGPDSVIHAVIQIEDRQPGLRYAGQVKPVANLLSRARLEGGFQLFQKALHHIISG